MIRRPRYGFCITLALALSGCYAGTVAYAPQDNVDFAVVQEIRQLDGTYRDVSDRSDHESGDAYLVESFTEILWRSGLVAATTVEVRAAGDDRVSIRSLDRNGTVLKQQVFVAGQDFEFVDGRLRFRRSNVLLQDKRDELFGPDVTIIEFGLDQRGQGKVRTTFKGVGIVLVLPTAIQQTMEYRFPRLGD